LSVPPQNRWREVSAEHASRSSGLLHVEASLARVSQSGLKTSGGATTGGARDTIARMRWKQVEDERVDAMGCLDPATLHLSFSMY
jgi:hypothetical protein